MTTLPIPICESLLSKKDAERLFNIGASIDHAMYARQVFRTETEMRISVLDAVHFPTPGSRYWQAIREQCGMVGELSRLFFDERRLQIRRRRAVQAQADAEARGDAIGFDEAQIDIDECDLQQRTMALEAKDRVREIMLWEELKQEQIAADPTFDRDDVNSHQLVSYTKQFILRAEMSDASKMSGGELDNLMGQLRSGVALAVKKGVIKQVLDGLPANAAKQTEKVIKHFTVGPIAAGRLN